MIWGLSIFTILLIGAFAFIMYQQKVQLNQWKADAAARTAKDKKLAAAEKPLMEKNNLPLPPPEPRIQMGTTRRSLPPSANR